MVLKRRFKRKRKNCRLLRTKRPTNQFKKRSSVKEKDSSASNSPEVAANKTEMLSKIKSTAAVQAAEQQLQQAANRATITNHQQSSISDIEEDSSLNNNNNNDNDSNNNNMSSKPCKRNQEELLDIVDVSRKRRLSKDSADQLASYIKFSFGQVEPSIKHFSDSFGASKLSDGVVKSEKIVQDDDQSMLDEEEWQFANNNNSRSFQLPEHLLRQHSKLSQPGSGSAINLALLSSSQRSSSNSNLTSALEGLRKRPRTQVYSPEGKPSLVGLGGSSTGNPPAGFKRSSSYLGNVVDRLHQQQQQQQQQARQQEEEAGSGNSGISYHLQQFLQQQTSLEDLCSSVGLDDSNQLVLAAAIHRALVDQGSSQLHDSSTGSSTGSSSGGSLNNNPTNLSTSSSSSNNLVAELPAAQQQRQRRAYNTRAALHGLSGSGGAGSGGLSVSAGSRGQSNSAAAAAAAAAAAMNSLAVGNRNQQQQRHAQAAAALSALASGATGHHQHHSAGLHQHQIMSSTNNNNNSTSMVDFECDICGSSFDDRHRLMQHQSIHLELKKDWFRETPVPEVMKIFNRRRGEFICDPCGVKYESTLDYDNHQHQVHGARPYCCQFCGNSTRTFRFWRQYLNHLYDHRYVFGCNIDNCDFTVSRRDSLRFHIFRFHLNCQLPVEQLKTSHGGHRMLLGPSNNNNNNNNNNIDEDVDFEDEMD